MAFGIPLVTPAIGEVPPEPAPEHPPTAPLQLVRNLGITTYVNGIEMIPIQFNLSTVATRLSIDMTLPQPDRKGAGQFQGTGRDG